MLAVWVVSEATQALGLHLTSESGSLQEVRNVAASAARPPPGSKKSSVWGVSGEAEVLCVRSQSPLPSYTTTTAPHSPPRRPL